MRAVRASIGRHTTRVPGCRRTRATNGDPSRFDNPGKLVRRTRWILSGVEGAEKRNDARDPFGSGLPVADAL